MVNKLVTFPEDEMKFHFLIFINTYWTEIGKIDLKQLVFVCIK